MMDQYKDISGNLLDVAVWLIAFKTMSNEHLVWSFWSRIWHWLETNAYIILMVFHEFYFGQNINKRYKNTRRKAYRNSYVKALAG